MMPIMLLRPDEQETEGQQNQEIETGKRGMWKMTVCRKSQQWSIIYDFTSNNDETHELPLYKGVHQPWLRGSHHYRGP